MESQLLPLRSSSVRSRSIRPARRAPRRRRPRHEEAGLLVEYDAADHQHAARHTEDVAREDLLRRLTTLVDRLVAARAAEAGRRQDLLNQPIPSDEELVVACLGTGEAVRN